MHKIILGTRKSPLALAQAEIIQKLLPLELSVEIRVIETAGDKNLNIHYKNSPLSLKGLFTKEIEDALLNGSIDMAVHSAKDLAAEIPKGLIIGAYGEREDCRDVLISQKGLLLADLPSGSVVGTSSIRREKQLQILRPDLIFKPIRGNINTRIEKLFRQGYDAIILAAAGLHRLHRSRDITQYFSFSEVIPAPAQGILALQCRADDAFIQGVCAGLNNQNSAIAARIERGFSARYGGGCSFPLACYAEVADSEVHIHAMLERNNELCFFHKVYPIVEGILQDFIKYVEASW